MTEGPDGEYVTYVRGRLTWLRKVAYLLCHDWHRADDLVQITITSLYLHWRKVRAADNIDGYVRRTLIHTFLSERRSRWASRVTLLAQPPEATSPASDDVTRIALRTALAAIAPRQRAVLVLRFYCDLSVEATADALGCSAGTVKSQSARGLVALRRVWQAPEPTSTTAREE